MTVRIATVADEAAVFDILVDLWRHNECGWGFQFSSLIVAETIECATRPDPSTRSNPHNQRRGVIGLIDGPLGRPIATVGIFLDPPVWFTETVVPTELWLYVRPEARKRLRLESELAAFAINVKERLDPHDGSLWPMPTGFMFLGEPKRFQSMMRLWMRIFRGAKPVGMLFWR